MVWIEVQLFSVAKLPTSPPLRGPLFTTATVGARVLTSTGLLLWSRPWWLIWNTSTGAPTRFFGHTSAASVFQVRSPPSKNRNGPKVIRLTTLLRLSLPSGSRGLCCLQIARLGLLAL